MHVKRRDLLSIVAAAGSAPVPARAAPAASEALKRRIHARLRGLPGTQAIKIWAPATRTRPEFLFAENTARKLFVGSAIKAFVLCERMRQLDGPDILARITATDASGATVPGALLALNESVWSVDSATFNPPHLSGAVTERTAMEAMILHSDNTATDMELKQAGPERVRAFLAEAGLHSSAVPDSTRAFFGHLLGAADAGAFTWAELAAAGRADKPVVNPPLNDVQTLASSADDLVSFYARSTQGRFFRDPATLQQYLDILSIGDVINLVPFPRGVSAYAKGGSIDVPGFHALCIPGAISVAGRWIFFAMVSNWPAPGTADKPTAERFVAAVRDVLQMTVTGLR